MSTEEKNIEKEEEKVNAEPQAANAEEQTADAAAAAPEQEEAAQEPAPEPTETELLQAKVAELNDKYLRLSADFDNYRKRTMKERVELTKSAGSDMLLALLPVVDDFERALSHMTDATDVAALREGVELIYNKFNDYLKKYGVQPIEAIGQPFDTDVHEAITKMPAPTPDMKGKVFDCVEKGYKMNDKVIRFSKVVVCE